jgi:hypothetical protein
MVLPKVYLAKSNRANPNLVTKVRQTLSSFQIEIVEYTGGLFSHAPMMECDKLVVVPDLSNDEVIIGKGLYKQIDRFSRCKGIECVLVLSSEDLDELYIRAVYDVEIINDKDYVSFACINFSSWGSENLSNILEVNYGYDSFSSTTSDATYYHLIGRKK